MTATSAPAGEYLAAPNRVISAANWAGGRPRRLAAEVALNQWALSGAWSVEEKSAALGASNGSITFRFRARDLNLVLTPPDSGAPVSFTVLLDGQPPFGDHGLDIDESGHGTVDVPRMYQLVRQPGGAARAHLRDHLSRPGRTRVCLHLRLIPRNGY
jgi:hypothetical protein